MMIDSPKADRAAAPKARYTVPLVASRWDCAVANHCADAEIDQCIRSTVPSEMSRVSANANLARRALGPPEVGIE